MATNTNATAEQSEVTMTKSPHNRQEQTPNFEPLDKSSSNTLKNVQSLMESSPSSLVARNPKMELSKTDLLKLLSYLEGELQARDIVIATLKSEKLKQLLNQGRYRVMPANDPVAALQRDSFAAAEPRVDEAEIRAIANQQMATLDNLILQHRRAQIKLGRILKEAEERHRKVVQELDEEKRKHEHDTAQGDDITYGLEKERMRLKQELELEKQMKKKLEKDLKKSNDTLEEERSRQKQIVLLLLAERKRLIMKYIEERKRSEDLAQILAEEKGRIDSMAEGLEEESKKSLQMEAELEKQLAQFDTERQQLKAAVAKEEKKSKELQAELERAQGELDSLRKQLAEAHQVAMFQAGASPPRMVLPARPVLTTSPPQPPAKPVVILPQTAPRPQPPSVGPLTPPKVGTWTVSDGSVSPPPPSQSAQPPAAGTPMMSSVAKVVQPTATVSSVPVCGPTTGIARSVSPGQGLRTAPFSATTTSDARSAPPSGNWMATTAEQLVTQDKRAQVVQVTPRVSLTTSPSSKVFASQGNKVMFHVTSSTAVQPETQTPPKKVAAPSRGVPPPVPPNKPIVPPKKEAVVRRSEPSSNTSEAVDGKKKYAVAKEKVQEGEVHENRREPQVPMT
ncbi:CTTNBP2 N-terminal-like protein isoform X2 [Schistocerca americana]|uniref:CTTNBP2 N-terminal-like protein isoform X2 n=1 Tax=Schistocerca americana TaxID=7009 RepID=UPI001F500042|nr:CTTNBP2 N-terminal-like protein isoform X2 [Schistocerca americana]